MRCLALFLLIFMALPGLAAAAPLPVISGEHDGFTRIVAQVPNGGDWKVSQEGRIVTLRLQDGDADFDTAAVFDRITRDRISGVESHPASLKLTLDCDCRVSAFASGADYAVIDVASPGVDLPTPLITPVSAVEPPAPTSREDTDAEPPILPLIIADPRPKQAPPALSLDRAVLTPEQLAVLTDVQDQLAEELGAAATRGLLDPAEGRQPSALPGGVARHRPDHPVEAPPPADAAIVPRANLRITSSIDRPLTVANREAGITSGGLTCPDDAQVAIATWGASDSFDRQISEARAGLYGELDRIDPEVALTLAKSYLYFGFGAEARQVLSLLPEPPGDIRLLFDLADIMDRGRPRWPEAMLPFVECTSDIALWAILALEDRPRRRELPNASALRSLNKLPAHLRRVIAPELSRRLRVHGHAEAAATALRSLERLPEALPPDAALAQAQMALEEGKHDTATDKLEHMVAENAAQSPEALATLVEARLQAREPVSPETAELVEAYAQELRDTAMGERLRHAHVMALVQSGQFDRAFAEAAALDGQADTEAAIALRLNMIRALTEAAGDIVFLDHALTQHQEDLALLHAVDRLDLAERLLDLGFAAEAQKVLAAGPEGPRSPRHQLLAAEAALALEQPFQAQAALLGIEVPAAVPLRARAKEMAGAFGEAHDLYQSSDLAEPALNAAWLAEDWRARTPAEDPVYGPVARLSETRTGVSDAPEGMLARSAAALEESAAARDTLSALLAATALPVAPAE